MALLKTVSPEDAKDEIKEAYSFFEKMGAPVPLPFQMMSASPGLLGIQKQAMEYFITHKSLSFPLLAHIRLLVANGENYQYCIDLNQGLLGMMAGLSQDQLEAAKANPEDACLEPKDKAMLLFVLKAVQDPALVQKNDVDALHELGWEDSDILDAMFHGSGMITAGMAFQAFKMGED